MQRESAKLGALMFVVGAGAAYGGTRLFFGWWVDNATLFGTRTQFYGYFYSLMMMAVAAFIGLMFVVGGVTSLVLALYNQIAKKDDDLERTNWDTQELPVIQLSDSHS